MGFTKLPNAIINDKKLLFNSKHSRNNEFNFLIDTGASVSLLKINNLNPNHKTEIKTDIKISIKGITDGTISSFGLVSVYMTKNGHRFHHFFHLVDSDTVPYDGILVADFLTKHNAIINYKTNLISLDPV